MGGWSGRMAPIIIASALALLGVFLASGDALGQSAPEDHSLSGVPDKDTAISISAQVSLVWQTDAQIMVANTSFRDNRLGAEATNGVVIDTLQKAAVTALSEAAMSGARTGHVDVVATVYRFAGDAALVDAWAPVGIFINTTDMAVETGGQAAFHTRVQFIQDASRTAAAGMDAPTR
jgi:hypothetical protein